MAQPITENYLAIYDVPLDKDLNTLDHYPSVWIGEGRIWVKIMGLFNFGKPKDEILKQLQAYW